MTSDELLAAIMEDRAATADCDHRDGWGSTIWSDGMCFLCGRTVRPRGIVVSINGTVLSAASLRRSLRRLLTRAPGVVR